MDAESLVVRRVGFRTGTDSELTSLHAVETLVAAERGSNRMPASLTSYISYAKNLPSQFDDHAWLDETVDGTPVAAAFCWSNAAGDPRVMECDILVHRGWRRHNIGSRLLGEICDESANSGQSLLTSSTFGATPAGEAFARQVGARRGRVNLTSELALDDVDWPMVRRWNSADEVRELGYVLEVVEGAFTEHQRADAAVFHHIMQTAPREDLEIGDVIVDTDFVAELDHALIESGRTRWTILLRDGSGTCVGGTEANFEPSEPAVAFQQNTGIDSRHRGFGLAKWLKAAMLLRIRSQRPCVERVRTNNALSNEPMLAINDSLGFKVVNSRTDWQMPISRAGDENRTRMTSLEGWDSSH